MAFQDVSPRPTAADTPRAYLPQLTVYLGKRDFVDHIDLVDPVGESLQRPGRKAGEGGADPAASREGLLEPPRNSSQVSRGA